MVERTQVLILGAGLAGLSTAYHLAGRRSYILVEREDEAGGLARSRQRDGYSFDATGHWFHSRDAGIRALVESLLGDNLVAIERRAAIFAFGRYLPFPFQANLAGLPEGARAECLLGLIDAAFGPESASRRATARTFDDWIHAFLGAGIARHFMVPYNTKLWTVPPSEMVGALCRKFVPAPNVDQLVRGALGVGPAATLGYNVKFIYPRVGGIGALPAALCARLPTAPRYGVRPTRVSVAERRAWISDGSEIAFDTLVSTISLKDLVALCEDAPAAVHEAAGRLDHNRVTYFDVAVRESSGGGAPPMPPSLVGDPRAAQWIYFPEAHVPFYRVGSYTAVLPTLAPPGCRSLYVEVAHRQDLDVDATRRACLQGLAQVGLIDSAEDVVFADAHEIPHAYVIPDAFYDASRETLFSYFGARHTHTIGRYGRWDYTSMEDTLIEGRAAAEAICG